MSHVTGHCGGVDVSQGNRLLSLAIGVSLVTSGAALAFPSSPAVGIALLGVGFAVCVAVGVGWVRQRSTRRHP